MGTDENVPFVWKSGLSLGDSQQGISSEFVSRSDSASAIFRSGSSAATSKWSLKP